jgi:hypothetical protein
VPSGVDQHSTNTQCSVLNTQSVPGQTKSGTKRTGAVPRTGAGWNKNSKKKVGCFQLWLVMILTSQVREL